jgi:flagellar motor switch protein FliN/FliY
VAVATAGFNGAFTLALPQIAVESFFAPLTGRRAAPLPPLVPPGAATSLSDVEVGVSVRTAPFTIRLGELGRLTAGSMLETGLSATADLTVRIEGIARFLAQPGRSGRRLAARVTQALTPAQQMAMATKGRTGPMATIAQDKEKAGAGAFAELTGSEPGVGSALTSLYQVSLPVTIELGRTRMSVQEILALGRGSVIELDRLVGEPVDVMVGDRRFADGEVVVVGDNFGVRITRMIANEPETGETP